MEIVKYTSSEFKNCIELFNSNLDRFFDSSELRQYEEFLKSEALVDGYYVVKENSMTVGAGGFYLIKNAFWLDWGIIHKNRHGQGIGSKLLEYRIGKIHQKNANYKVKLCTSQHTVGFYEKHGFKVLNCTENGYGINLHKYELEKMS